MVEQVHAFGRRAANVGPTTTAVVSISRRAELSWVLLFLLYGGKSRLFCQPTTPKRRWHELSGVVDIKILVDDSSKDQTVRLSKQLRLITFAHKANYGYGRNQQTCYREAVMDRPQSSAL